MIYNITDTNNVKVINIEKQEEDKFLEHNGANFIKQDSVEIPEGKEHLRYYPNYIFKNNKVIIDEYKSQLNYILNARAIEYNKLNQDEMRFDDEVNGTTTWVDAILAIKEKYPKPEQK